MGKQVTIKAKYSRVILPDGKAYDGNDVATLSDADFARMSADLLSYVTVGSTVADPVSSLDLSGDTQQDAASIQAYIDAALVALAASYEPLAQDTGWRDVSGLFAHEPGDGLVLLRRVGQTVSIAINPNFLDSWGDGTPFPNGPPLDGFTPPVSAVVATPLVIDDGSPRGVAYINGGYMSGYNLDGSGSPDGPAAGYLTFLTDDAWPTVLPGTAH